MKKIIILFAFIMATPLMAQLDTKSTASFKLGDGFNFALNDGAYQFKLSGTLQPYMAFSKQESIETDYFFNSRRTYLNFSGKAKEEKVSFFLQMDFSDNEPLLDAWIAYNPWECLTITAGQKQVFTNNREMLIMENKLQFPDRGVLSTSFSETGREFGVFVENKINLGSFKVVPQVSVTSGDGRNSFGADSRDVDLGGIKYGGRLDVYPLDYFTKGNDDLIADLAHEKSLKFVIGGAYSYNDGASNSIGEGHGDFFLYDGLGDIQLPDYRQLYGDILIKYKGFSLLGEYGVATATQLQGSFTSTTGSDALAPTQISEYLALGTSYNAQIGYVTKSGYALDLRYGAVTPEFETNANSVIQEVSAYTIGFSKYFKENALKIQAAVTSTEVAGLGNTLLGELLFQITF